MYLLDANTFIQAKNLYYSMDFCPAYWSWLDKQSDAGHIGSVIKVYDELKTDKDDLSDWAKDRKDHFIRVDDGKTQERFAEIAQYLFSKDYNPGERDRFLAKADPWLIAKASTIGATVVTQEVSVPSNSKKVKVPNICDEFNVFLPLICFQS